MSQRNSGYEKRDLGFYPTPAWVTEALIPHLPRKPVLIWEPACGDGHMVKPLSFVANVEASDIRFGRDFLEETITLADAIITNPPFDRSREFIEHGLRLMEPIGGQVAMLLRTDYEHAATRAHLFRDCPAFCKKVALTKRITWFVEADGKPKASPSYNHSWFLWDWRHEGAPTLAFAP